MPGTPKSPDPRLRYQLTIAAREKRRHPTPAERLLWERLRRRQLDGYCFRRQHPIDRFIVDFYCAEAGLVIEVDGASHDGQIALDAERDAILATLGLRVLRVRNEDVLHDLDHVLARIARQWREKIVIG